MGGVARPFPMSFYAKGLKGHIYNPRCGLERPRRVDAKWYQSCAPPSRGMVAKPSGIKGSAGPAGSADGGARQLHRDVRCGKTDLTGRESVN